MNPTTLFDLLPEPVADQPCTIYAQKRLEVVGPIVSRWTEAEFQERVDHLCHLYGGLQHHHCGDARMCHGNGFPDLVIVGPLGTLWRELKVRGRELSPGQRRWGDALKAAGQDWKVWTERDYASGLITQELASICELKAIGQLPLAA